MGFHAELSNQFNTNKDPSTSFSKEDREDSLEMLIESYKALAADTTNLISNLSNASSLLWHCYKGLNVNVNWTGFYILNKDSTENVDSKPKSLILGPFQGKVACQEIFFGKGVCGTAASEKKTQLVTDVNQCVNHIACDGETKSEIVVPILYENEVVGVIDLDCLDLQGFDELDQAFLEQLAKEISSTCDWKKYL
ncbi:hypothetical protein ACO0SA_002366 [Hanseniaspora valbyensis]